MIKLDRRAWMAGAAAASLAPSARAAEPVAAYDYLFLDLRDASGTTPARAYADAVRARQPAITAAGGTVLGLFTPQIGWVARQAALLVRWDGAAAGRGGLITNLTRDKTVLVGQRVRLAPSPRPLSPAPLWPGGIYVHRWFVVGTKDVPQFIELSVEGWRDFESRFDTQIYGLFTAERSQADMQKGVRRLMLLTRYASHGVWEASRDPSTAAMAAFQRRGALTRDTWNASSLDVSI